MNGPANQRYGNAGACQHAAEIATDRPRTDKCDAVACHRARNMGRVRHVGPPAPGRQISLPSNSDMLQPAASSRERVMGFPRTMIRLRGEIARTLQPSDSYS